MVVSLYCWAFVIYPMWDKVVKLKVSHIFLIFSLRHCPPQTESLDSTRYYKCYKSNSIV